MLGGYVSEQYNIVSCKICILVENMPTFKPPLQIQSPQGKD